MSERPEPRLSVVMAVHNQAKSIEESLRRVDAFLSLEEDGSEILVSDDGSNDDTGGLVLRFIQAHPARPLQWLGASRRVGIGAAVRRGVLAAKGRHILIADAKLPTPMKESEKLLKAIRDGYDGAIGSRILRSPGADVQQSAAQRVSLRARRFWVHALALDDYEDTECRFKCFKRAAARTLFGEQMLNGPGFDVEVLMLAKKRGFRIKEIPVMWRQSPPAAAHSLWEPFAWMGDLWKIHNS